MAAKRLVCPLNMMIKVHTSLNPVMVVVESHYVPVLGRLSWHLGSLWSKLIKTRQQLLVVKGEGTTLLGRDWMQKPKLDWKNIFN